MVVSNQVFPKLTAIQSRHFCQLLLSFNYFVKFIITTHKFGRKSYLIHLNELKELIYQDKSKKIKLKLELKNARYANIANFE